MTSNELYILYRELVNRNATNNNVAVDKPRFVNQFNDTAVRFVEWIFEKKNSDDIRDISVLLENRKKLKRLKDEDTFSMFSNPSDYFNLVNVFVKCKKGNCVADDFVVYEAKGENLHELYQDINSEPDFFYRESFYHTSDDSITIYKKDFEIKEAYLAYYRLPIKIDLGGYINAEGNSSQTIDPEFNERVSRRIVTAMARDFSARNSDPTGYQVNEARLFAKA